jgi:AbrB family looped-hinge helix DNA binding protein
VPTLFHGLPGEEFVSRCLHRFRKDWYDAAMTTAMDSAGRIVIPKALRERLGLEPGRVVDIRERDGRIEIEPAPTPMTLVRRRGGQVAVPGSPLPPLTDEIVRATIEGTRR